jgi:hypothetical protein
MPAANAPTLLQAWYDHFVLKPISLLGLSLGALPPLDVPIPALLMSRGSWCTTYVDEDTRVARARDAIFLFKK